LFIDDTKSATPTSVPIYEGDISQLFSIPPDGLRTRKIVGLKETPFDLNYTAKVIKDERIKKQMINISGLVPEMAIFS
jgi:hypothetical protein